MDTNTDPFKTPETALRLNQAMLDTIDALVVVLDCDGRIVLFNHACEATTGYRAEEVRHRLIWDVLIPDENIEPVKQVFSSLTAGQFPNRHENEWVRQDGANCLIRWSNTVILDDKGGIEFVIGTGIDITEQHTLQERYVQAQKMEAIGQLTGGVAHDFNNLLTVIVGNLEMLEPKLVDDGQSSVLLEEAMEAAELGGQLTGRMLAFARRQPLEPKVIDLNVLVLELTDMLRRTLGESIEITTVLAQDLGQTKADPAQLQNALLNLCINARDAMPNGGKLTIETTVAGLDEDYAADHADVSPGDYIMLSVSDNGTGIPPEIQQRVLEPFFTTKEVGAGTGLGLSTIYGFSKQSGGHLRLYSEMGVGTTVSLYLPLIEGVISSDEEQTVASDAPEIKRETILVVEDDHRVRTTTVARVQDLGYDVLQAEDGKSALKILRRSPAVDLLFTDVVMPGGMMGGELVEEAKRFYPGLKVLFTSGYTEQASLQADVIEGGAVLKKPYRRPELASKLREALDG